MLGPSLDSLRDLRAKLAVSLVLAALATGCGSRETSAPESSSLSITPATLSVLPGETSTLALVKITNGASAAAVGAKWTSADPSTVVVDAAGRVTGVRPGGPVTISAKVGNLQATAAISVANPRRFSVSVYRSAGVSGTGAGTTSTDSASLFAFSFVADQGYRNLRVTIDSVVAPAVGSARVVSDVSILATAEAIPQNDAALSAASAAVASAVRGQQLAPLTHLLDSVSALAQTDPTGKTMRDAKARLFSALDPITDASRYVQMIDRLADSAALATNRAQMGASLSSGMLGTIDTRFLYVNGIATSAIDASQTASNWLSGLLSVAGFSDKQRFPVTNEYNRAAEKIPATKRNFIGCMSLTFASFNAAFGGLLQVNIRKGIEDCMRSALGVVPPILFDLIESAQQVVRLVFELPATDAPQDVDRVAARISNALNANQRIVLVTHSQGNLIAQEAIRKFILANPNANKACIGVVGIAPPLAWSSLSIGVPFRETIAVEGPAKDVLAAVGLAGGVPIHSNQVTSDYVNFYYNNVGYSLWKVFTASEVRSFADKFLVGPDIHGITNYLGLPQSQTAIRDMITDVVGRMNLGCPNQLQTTRTTVAFSGQESGALPAAQSLTIDAQRGQVSGVTATTSYSVGSNWLRATVNGTATPIQLDLQPVTTGLSVGTTYRATVRLSSAGSAPLDIAVSYNLSPATEPTVTTLSATQISFSGFTINGTIDPRGLSPIVNFFERFSGNACVGTAIVNSLPDLTVGGSSPVNRSFVVSNAAPSSAYSYRLAASRANGLTQRGSCIAVTTSPDVTDALVDLRLSPAAANLLVGQQVTLVPTPTIGGAGVTVSYAYSSDNSAVVTVSANGLVSALAAGQARITVVATGVGVGFVTSQRVAQAQISVTSSNGNCIWCDATVGFDGNTLPTGWQQARFGPNSAVIANGRVEATATDRGLTFRAVGAPPLGTRVIEVTTEGPMADVYFGMQNAVQLETGSTAWVGNLSTYTCLPSAGCGLPAGAPNQLVMATTQLNGYVWPTGASSGGDVTRSAATYVSGTVLRVVRQFADDNVTFIVRRVSDNQLIVSRTLALPGFRVANVTAAGFFLYFTSISSLSPAWLDNVTFRFVNASGLVTSTIRPFTAANSSTCLIPTSDGPRVGCASRISKPR